jgi:hypothetical protein
MENFKGSTSLETRASNEDVGRYLDGHMFLLPGFVVCNPKLQDEIKTEIVRSIDGMYAVSSPFTNRNVVLMCF